VWANASRLKHDSNVAAWLAAGRRTGFGKAAQTFNGYLSRLEEVGQKAEDAGDYKTALRAVESMGTACGHNVQRSELTINMNPAAILSQLADLDADIARQIAHRYAIPLALPGKVVEHEG
jgi:hypothetical protein